MANSLKVLGQSNPAATTPTSLYTVPSATSAVLSTLTICNLAAANANYRLAVRPAGASLANTHYIAYDNVVAGYDTVALTLGLTLAATDVITVYSSTASVTFAAFGTEVT
jgi:dihydrodipicolinate synthase/N-acetylneuraminate lyase